MSRQLITTPYTPEKILPAGDDYTQSINPYTGEAGPARKGIVAATLNNVALLNTHLEKGEKQEIEEIVNAVRALIPSLKVVGVFHLFTPLEWVSSNGQPGRILAGVLFLQAYPQEMTPEIQAKLKQIRAQMPISYLIQQIDMVLKN